MAGIALDIELSDVNLEAEISNPPDSVGNVLASWWAIDFDMHL